MALRLTSQGLREEVARHVPSRDALPLSVAAGTALCTSNLLRSMKPGGAKTLACLTAFGGGTFLATTKRTNLVKSASVGIAMGGIWTLLMRG